MGLWNAIKTGAKKFGKFVWDHREGIGKAIGAGLDVASTLGVPGANIASKIVHGVGNVSKSLGDDKFSKGLASGSRSKGESNGNDFDSLKAAYKKAKAERKNKQSESAPISQPSSGGYSVSTRNSGGTKEGAMFNSYRSFRLDYSKY